MIPGKHYTPELVLSIAWRRKWLILIPTVVVAVIACGVTYMLPDRYRSEAAILVVPQQVPQSYVKSTVTTSIESRLRTINQQVRSRSRLERIIEDLSLYTERRKTDIMQDIVDDMSDDIGVEILQGDVFKVSFTADNPRTAKDVTEQLTSFFIDESLKDRTALADNTSSFLEGQVADAGRALREVEQKIAQYKQRFDGELPSQVDANQGGLQGAQMQLMNVNAAIERDRGLQGQMQRQLENLTSLADAAAEAPPVIIDAGPSRPRASELAKVSAELKDLKSKGYKAGYPEVDKRERRIPQLEREAAEEAASLTPLTPQGPAPNTLAAARLKELASARADLDTLTGQIEKNTEQKGQLEKRITDYQRRIEAAPIRDTELVELTRDYGTMKAQYDSLTGKKLDSEISADVERRQIGEQFKVLDPARLPEKPSSPQRDRMYLVSIVLAVITGLGAAAGAEYLDRGLRSEDDVRLALALPVLATIPVIGTPPKMTLRRKILAGSAVAVMLTAAAGAAWLVLR